MYEREASQCVTYHKCGNVPDVQYQRINLESNLFILQSEMAFERSEHKYLNVVRHLTNIVLKLGRGSA